jgi:hypothetical protein
MPYQDFGPQAMSYELLGMEWNQWKSEGHPLPDDVEVKVVVYRAIDLSQVEKEFPVLKGKSDYRYLEYSRAILYLRENMKTVESYRQEEAEQPQPEPNAIKMWDELVQTLKKTQGQIIENLGA